MVVLAAFSVLSVDHAIQWLNQYSPKHKIGNRFCPLCIFHILERFPFNLPMCYLHPRLSHPISLFFIISSGLVLLLHWSLMHNYVKLLWRFYVICHEENLLCLRSFSILMTQESISHILPLIFSGIITNCIYLNIYKQKSWYK